MFSFFRTWSTLWATALGDSRRRTDLRAAVRRVQRQDMVDEVHQAPAGPAVPASARSRRAEWHQPPGGVHRDDQPSRRPSPATEAQAIARAHRMGQVETVQVHRLLTQDSVDERIGEILDTKARLFDEYARKSDAKEVDRRATDREWHRPAELDDAAVPLERRVIMAEEHRLSEQPGSYQ